MFIPRNFKIRQKLTMLLLVIGLIPTICVSLVAYLTLSNQLTNKTVAQLDSISIKQAEKVNAVLQSRQEELLKMANRYDLQVAISDYSTGKGSAEAIGQVLRSRKAEMSEVLSVRLSSPAGRIIASTSPSEQGTAFEGAFVAKEGQENSITIQEDATDAINKLFVATKMTVNQKNAGILTLTYPIDSLVATLQDYTGLGTTGETVIGGEVAGKAEVSLFPLRFEQDAALHRSLKSLRLNTESDRSYDDVPDYRNNKVMVSSRSLSATDWVLATKIDTEEALAPIVSLRNTLAVIVIGSSVAISIIAFYMTRFLTAPIIALTQKTRLIMQGDFTQRIMVTSRDEIGTLAEDFNRMTSELAGLYKGLESKVRERTQALNQKVKEVGDAKAKDDAILESIGEGMVVTDSEGHVLLMNEIAGSLLHVNRKDIVGKSLSESVLYDDGGKVIPPEKRPMERALRTGHKVVMQARSIQNAEHKRAVDITATPVLQHGKMIGAIQIIRDVTKEKEIDRMKTEFISVASHQLRTPLSAIKWFSGMMLAKDKPSAAEMEEFTENIAASAQRMIELVNSLLNISRIESGRIIVDPKPTDLNELVTGIVNDLKGKTSTKRQELSISVASDLPKIKLDPRLIGQVYLNLLTNAIKYTPAAGKITVHVSHRGNRVVSEVTDNGYGIPEAEQGKMFQKFFRASNIAKVETDGTGLGMYLIKAIIESSGGKIWFKSKEGKGTSFWFSLPITGMKAKEGEVTID